MLYKLIFLLCVINFLCVYSDVCRLNEVYKWKQMSFAGLPHEDDYRIRNYTYYIPYNNIPTGVSHFNNRIFISIARRTPGIPSTLNYFHIDKNNRIQSPPLRAYPNFEINDLHPNLEEDTKKIVSVYRTRIDICKRLWFIDTGMLEYRNNYIVIQRPSIWVINLMTDQVIRRFEIPVNIVDIGYGLTSLTIDVELDSCDEAFAYIPDLQTYRLIVYSFKDDRAWRFLHNSFYLDPIQGNFNVAGINFAWDDGIFSIALSGINADNYKTVFYHALSSTSEFTVSTQVLRNETLSARSYHADDFSFLGYRGDNSQSGSHAYHVKTGVLFYTQIQKNTINCWQQSRILSETNFANICTHNTMIYPNDLNIDLNDNLWVMSNSIPKFIYSTLNPNEYNFRIWRQSVDMAIRRSVCSKRRTGYLAPH